MNKSVKLIEVARAAGVSKSTASRALTGSTRVKAETRAHVNKVAASLGYIRDRRAAELAGWHHCAIGMMVKGTDSPFYSEIITAAQTVCDQLELELLIVNGGDDYEHQRHSLENLIERRVDGIIIASGRAQRQAILEVAKLRPVTTIGIDMSFPQADTVVIAPDSENILAQKVVETGHKIVGVLTATPQQSYTLNLRSERFGSFLKAAQVKVIPIWVSEKDNSPQAGDLERAIAAQATAFMAGDDLQALTIMEFLSAQGHRVPDNISVTGFDGIGPFASPLLGISTIRQPIYELVDTGIKTLLKRIDNPDLKPQYLTFPGELITGRTLGEAFSEGK